MTTRKQQQICSSCGEILTIEAKLENKLGSRVNVCINCFHIAINEIKKEEQQKYHRFEGEIDI